MEDVMQASARRELESVRHRPDALQHLKGPGKAGAKLALGARLLGQGRPVKKTQPHPIAHRELQITVRGIVVLRGELLRLE